MNDELTKPVNIRVEQIFMIKEKAIVIDIKGLVDMERMIFALDSDKHEPFPSRDLSKYEIDELIKLLQRAL